MQDWLISIEPSSVLEWRYATYAYGMYIVGTKAIYRPMLKELCSIYVNVIAMLLQIKV